MTRPLLWHRPVSLTACLLATILGAAVLAPRGAAAATAALSGPSRFLIADCNALTVTLRFTADAEPLAIRTSDATATGSSAPVGWTIDWDKPRSSNPDIKEYTSTGSLKSTSGASNANCPAVGTYAVPLIVTFAGGPGVPLAITLTRTAEPVLDAPTSVTIPVWIWPWDAWLRTPVQARTIDIRESSTNAPIDSVTAVGAELRNTTGESAGIELVPDPAPLHLDKGAGGQIKLNLPAAPDPGSYTSKLTLYPKSQPAKSIDVTLKVRDYFGWLLLLIALGVGLGWLVNVRLAYRAAIDAGRLAALAAADAIGARAAAQKDPAVQQRLLDVARTLGMKLRAAATTDAVKAQVDAANYQADTIETQATAAVTAFTQALTQARVAFSPDGHPLDDLIAAPMNSQIQELERISRAGETGDVERAIALLKEFMRTLDPAALKVSRDWLESVRATLDAVGPWADASAEPEKTRQVLIAAMTAASAAADAANAMKLDDTLARQLRAWAWLVAPDAIAAVLHRAAGALTDGGKATEAAATSALAAEVARVSGGAADPIATLGKIADVRRGAEALLRGLAPGNAALDADLLAGNFVAAARRVAPPPAPPAAAMAAIASLAPLQHAVTVLGPAPVVTPPPRLIVPARLQVGADVMLSIDPPGACPNLTCEPANSITFKNVTPNGANAKAIEAGFITITADLGGPVRLSATIYAGEAMDTNIYRTIADNAGSVGFWTSLVTAAVTVAAGFVLFNANWVGTWSDWFGAFAWGFFGQFGLERVRTLAQPITSRTL